MEDDPLRQAWQAPGNHPQLRMDMEQVMSNVCRDQQAFASIIFWRDVREVGVSLVLIPVWIVMGVALKLPWAWYLVIPGLVWIAAFMLIDRRRQRRKRPERAESLRRHVEDSLAEVEHQIWLLRNVFWWYLVPMALPMFAFFAQVSWRVRHLGGWEAVFGFALMAGFVSAVFAFVYWLNRVAVRTGLEPRRAELARILGDLQAEIGESGQASGRASRE